jgi:hypothetical protein
MPNPHPIVAALVLVAILVGLALVLLQALRRGHFSARGGYIVRRRKQPIQFWLSIVVGCAFLVVGFGGLAHIIWQAV